MMDIEKALEKLQNDLTRIIEHYKQLNKTPDNLGAK